MYSICAVTNGEVSGWYKLSSLWVLVKDNTIGWVTVCGWVAEKKEKNGGPHLESFL